MRQVNRTILSWAGAFAVSAMFSLSAMAATGITITKHNLSTSGTGSNKMAAGGTDQICVFCHTPHGADTTQVLPLWNKKPTASAFTTYNSLGTSTLQGEVLTVGSVSIACLSCHDGTQAMDNIINAPGSGGYSATGGGASGLAYTWAAGGAETLSTTPFPNLGTDLRNDHPIGVEYCGGGLSGSSTTVSGTCADDAFIGSTSTTTSDGRAGVLVKTASVNSNQVFWVDLGGTGRNKTDIMLYSRTFAAGAGRPSVECGSCHDPHVETKGSDNMAFMRVTTAGSQICLSCHVK